MSLDFDPVEHRYTLDGQLVPSVTTILRATGIMVPPPISEEDLRFALDRGTALHSAVELLDLGTLDEESVDPAIAGRLDAYRRFRDEVRLNRIGSEECVSSRRHRFAGTLDLVGFLSGHRAIVDLKGAATADRATAIQTAAYRLAWNEDHPGQKVERTYSLNLRDDGTYRLTRLDTIEPMAEQVFLAALTVYNWRTAHGR